MVVASALFDKPAFHNVVVNGLVLAEDGKKMSKRLKNYPEPEDIIAEHGADALRLYLINSPLVRAEELRFSEPGVRDTVRRLLLPWWNVYKFFVTYALVDEWKPALTRSGASPNILDRWILSRQQTLIRRTSEEMESYRLYNVVPALLDFLDELTNGYVRLNRRRFWSETDTDDKRFAYRTLYDVLVGFSKLMAPFTPFLSEAIYRNLRTLQEDPTEESVHLAPFPPYDERLADLVLEDAVARMQRVILLGRSLRNERKVKVRMPLRTLTILHRQQRILDEIKPLEKYIRDELNVKEVRYSTAEGEKVALSAKPNAKLLGPRFGKKFSAVSKQVVALSSEQMLTLEAGGTLTLDGEVFRAEEVQILRQARDGTPDVRSDRFISIEFPCELDEELIAEGLAREIVHAVQQMRKDAGYRVEDRIAITYDTDGRLSAVIDQHTNYIQDETLARSIRRDQPAGDRVETVEIDNATITLGVQREATEHSPLS
jgi:isoleucyl-tRNA synthetase